MASKYMKFNILKGMQVKITLRFHSLKSQCLSSENKQQQILAVMQGERNPYILLVGM
jgi:hypothetical protein